MRLVHGNKQLIKIYIRIHTCNSCNTGTRTLTDMYAL